MNTGALITIAATWAIVIGFAGYFFFKVLKGDQHKNSDEEM